MPVTRILIGNRSACVFFQADRPLVCRAPGGGGEVGRHVQGACVLPPRGVWEGPAGEVMPHSVVESTHAVLSWCVFQGPRGLPGERGRTGPAGAVVSDG